VRHRRRDSHLRPDTIENYALTRLTPAEVTCVEVHLLCCSTCRDRLSEFDDFFRQALIDSSTANLDEAETKATVEGKIASGRE
jgi:hypothetical protein